VIQVVLSDDNVGGTSAITSSTSTAARQSSLHDYLDSPYAGRPQSSRPEQIRIFPHSVGINDAEQPGPSYMNGSANIIQSACSDESEESKVEILREMFPDKDGEQIKIVLRQAQNDVRVAVNKLLFGVIKATACDSDDDNGDQDEWLWNTPLAALPIMRTDNAVMSLKKFTAEALKPFGCDMDVHVYRNTDLLKQMLRKYKNPGFDITRPLCVEFVDELGVDAGGVCYIISLCSSIHSITFQA